MARLVGTVCVLLTAAVLGGVSHAQPAEPTTRPDTIGATRPDTISVERQLRLKRKLLMGHASLIAALQSNRQSWDRYSPEQRHRLRQRAYAFRQADPAQHQAVMDAWERFMALDDGQKDSYRQRAAWLTAVIAELPPETRDELIKLPAAERARRLLELKRQMEAAGKLPASVPASQPTTRPAASQPAAQ